MIKLEHINKDEAARYMGIRGVPEDNVAELIRRCEKRVLEVIRPAYVYRETDISFGQNGVTAACMPVPMTGKSIADHLKGCTKAVLLAVTLSAEADKLIRQTAVTDMAESLAVDCLCSAAVEQVCDIAEKEIFSGSNYFRTWRFSPGYGDLPLELQRDFLLAVNAQRRIGLTATENSLLLPTKSVTAIIGISDKPLRHSEGGCAVCNMRERCAYNKNGVFCNTNSQRDYNSETVF